MSNFKRTIRRVQMFEANRLNNHERLKELAEEYKRQDNRLFALSFVISTLSIGFVLYKIIIAVHG